MGEIVSVDGMAAAINEMLEEYADLTNESMKDAVTKAAKTVREETRNGAPVRTGKYQKSWTSKKTKESANTLEVTVYSSNRYQLAHLLEHGHAHRNGGRARAIPHIAPAEQKGIDQLEQEIERALQNG